MVSRKTFCVKDFSTIFLRVACIFETSCKILSINDLRAQGGGARKCLTINDLRKLDLDHKTGRKQKIRSICQHYPIYYLVLAILLFVFLQNKSCG